MGPDRSGAARQSRHGWVWSLLTFERMITGPVIHIVYWAGLGVIVIAAFGVVGASGAIAARAIIERSFETLKKYEQVAEQARSRVAQEAARREGSALDEVGLRRASGRR